jgi:hypothetical protein
MGLWAHLLVLRPLRLALFPIKPKDLRYPFDGLMGLVGPFVGFGTFALDFVPNKTQGFTLSF